MLSLLSTLSRPAIARPAVGRASFRLACPVLALGLLAGCATPPPPGADTWHGMNIPGKTPTSYAWTEKEGRTALRAESLASASMWRKRVDASAPAFSDVNFSWWVQDLVPNASVADVEREDAPARLIFGFEGDVSSLPRRTRVMFELAQALTGEEPPYATLMYVWDSQLPVDTVVVNPRSDRIRKIVVDSGPKHLRKWRHHSRNLKADFKRAFGEDPGRLTSVAVMTDSDNTRSQGSAWYGAVELRTEP